MRSIPIRLIWWTFKPRLYEIPTKFLRWEEEPGRQRVLLVGEGHGPVPIYGTRAAWLRRPQTAKPSV